MLRYSVFLKRNVAALAVIALVLGMSVWVGTRPASSLMLPIWFLITGFVGIWAGRRLGPKISMFQNHGKEQTSNPTFSNLHPDLIAHIERSPQLLEFLPKTKPMTVVHVEIVAFHDMLRRFSPDQVFGHMQETYDHVTSTVTRFGGFILPGYRGGFLFAFGDVLGVKIFRSSHADRALHCAHALQMETASRLSRMIGQEGPAFSLRIGIVTSQTFVGNFGNRYRLDMAILGDAIGEAEAVCRSGGIGTVTVSELTLDLAETLSRTSKLVKEHVIALPGGADGIFYDLDVFFEHDALRTAMVDSVKQAAAVVRREARFDVGDVASVQVMTDLGPVKLLNISRNGMGIHSNASVEKGQTVQMSITTSSQRINDKLKTRSLAIFNTEVVFISADRKQIGLIHKSVPKRDRDFLLHSVLEAVENS